MKILCIGQITYDYSLPIDGFPIEGLKYDLPEKIENSGGSACNSAYALAKWKEDVSLSAAVGGDELGSKIRKDLEGVGINPSYIEIVYEGKTPISFILINKNTGNKTIFNINGNEPHVKKYEYDFVPEIILMDGYEYSASVAVCNRYQNAISILDASECTKEMTELCKYAKYIIASQKFAEDFTSSKMDFSNPTSLLEIYKKIAVKYPNSNLIITLKDHGAMYLDKNQIKVMPGLKVEDVKDTTGAGDLFRAAFAAGISRGYEMEKIIRVANIASGLSLKKMGAKESVPLFSDVAKYYETKFGSIELPVNGAEQSVEETPKTKEAPNIEETKVEEPKVEGTPDTSEVTTNDVSPVNEEVTTNDASAK